MELYVTLLYVVALLSLAGSTRGDDDTTTSCTLTPTPDQGIQENIYEMAMRCISMDKDSIAHIHGIDTLEAHKTFFKNLCDKKQEVSGCLELVTHTSQVCNTEVGHRFYLIYRDLLETLPDIVCVQDGEIIAKFFMTYSSLDTPLFRSDSFHNCVITAMTRIVRLMDDAISPYSRLYIIYRGIGNCKECFGQIDEGDIPLMKAIESLLGEVIDKMKCMHPQEDTPVLCKDIDINLPEVPRICPIKTLDEENHPLHETILLEGINWCLSATFLEMEGLHAVDSLESSWEFVVQNCKKKETIKKCMSKVVALSSVCLNEAHNQFVGLVDDVLTHGLDSLCVVDGGHSGGYVLYKALSKSGATVRHNAISDCFTLAHPQPEETRNHMDPADFLKFYQELKVFKGCVIKEMFEDNRAVFDALFFLSSVERKMKCLDPEHGTTVLCENMDTASTTEVGVCPLVGGVEPPTPTPTYERLYDMSILCLKAATVKLDPVRRFTTQEQFQTFFKSFCPNREHIKRCLGDVSSLSTLCLTINDQKLLTILNDIYEKVLTSGCEQEGEVFATLMNGMWADDEHAIDGVLLETCVNTASQQFDNHVIEPVSNRTVHQYQVLGKLRECILNGATDGGTFKTLFTTVTNELLGDLKCVHPNDETLVSCKSFVH